MIVINRNALPTVTCICTSALRCKRIPVPMITHGGARIRERFDKRFVFHKIVIVKKLISHLRRLALCTACIVDGPDHRPGNRSNRA
jgi:hypothetical protein